MVKKQGNATVKNQVADEEPSVTSELAKVVGTFRGKLDGQVVATNVPDSMSIELAKKVLSEYQWAKYILSVSIAFVDNSPVLKLHVSPTYEDYRLPYNSFLQDLLAVDPDRFLEKVKTYCKGFKDAFTFQEKKIKELEFERQAGSGVPMPYWLLRRGMF